jgi:octaprenyl-diphosphate synthase
VQQPTSTPPDLAQIFEPVREELTRVEREFAKHLESRVELIPQIGKYVQTSGGKRVRPAVLLMAARLCGYSGELAVLNAAVVEFVHTATLVHDDIIDSAETRRGRLTVHSRWGSDVSVLLGDYLYIRSMSMALSQVNMDIVRLLCDCTLRLIEGELYQLTKTGDASITEAEHFEIIRHKTAHLFAGCAEIGGMLGDADAAKREALREYGGAEAEHVVHSIMADGQVSPEQWRTIRELLERHGAIEAAFARATTHAERAKERLLGAFGPSPERDGLISLADYVINRDR